MVQLRNLFSFFFLGLGLWIENFLSQIFIYIFTGVYILVVGRMLGFSNCKSISTSSSKLKFVNLCGNLKMFVCYFTPTVSSTALEF